MISSRVLKMVEVLAAIVGIVVLEGIALSKGINGATLSVTLTVLGGLAGYEIGMYRKKDDEPARDELPEELME